MRWPAQFSTISRTPRRHVGMRWPRGNRSSTDSASTAWCATTFHFMTDCRRDAMRLPRVSARTTRTRRSLQTMCGITGIFETRERREIERDVLVRMNETQHHRGPDDAGYHIEPGVGLGHRRLSIIDIATGQQPLYNEDGSVVVIFNGEIYNFQPLISELTALGHVFHTKSDTEVIVHGWEAWG